MTVLDRSAVVYVVTRTEELGGCSECGVDTEGWQTEVLSVVTNLRDAKMLAVGHAGRALSWSIGKARNVGTVNGVDFAWEAEHYTVPGSDELSWVYEIQPFALGGYPVLIHPALLDVCHPWLAGLDDRIEISV